MRKIIIALGLVLFFISFLNAQPAKKEAPSTKQKDIYDLEVNDLYLDRDNKICVVLRLLEGTIPASNFGRIKLSLKVPSFGNIPDIELSRVDPSGELNSRKRKDFNTGLILKNADNVSCSLINISDKNAQNNTLKERLTPSISQAKEEKTPPVKSSTLPSTTQVTHGQTQGGSIGTGVPKTGEIVKKTTPEKPEGQGLMPISSIPDVANILQLNLSTVSPRLWEMPYENYPIEHFRLDWNQFAFPDFKEITLRINYIGDSRERRIDEKTFRKGEANTYVVTLQAIFDWLRNNRIISQVESWKIYRFKITGTLALEKPSPGSSQGASQRMGSGTQMATQQATTVSGASSTTRTVLPTNSFLVDLFLKGREETRVSPPSSSQVGAGIRFAPLPPSSEGRFKIILDSYLPEDLRDCHWTKAVPSCNRDELGCFIQRVFMNNFTLEIENSQNINDKCTVGPFLRDKFRDCGEGILGSTSINIGLRDCRGIEGEFSLSALLSNPPCNRRLVDLKGKTFRIWGHGEENIEYENHYMKTRSYCAIDKKSKRISVYSPQAVYITIYPEDVIQDLQSQTQTQIQLPQTKPRSLRLEHPVTQISLPTGLTTLGAKIDFSQALKVNWQDSIRDFPSGSETWIEVRKAVSNELITDPHIREGTSSEIRPASGRTSIAGGFPAGVYKVQHKFCYPIGSTLNPSSTLPLCTAISDPVYFQSYMPISKVTLQFSDFRLSPRNNHHGLSVRLSNLSNQDLSGYVSFIGVEGLSSSCPSCACYFNISTSMLGSRGGEAHQAPIFELPSQCDILSHLAQDTITLRIRRTELWDETSIMGSFTIPQQDRSNLHFQGPLSFSRSNDGRQIIVNFRVVEDLRGKGVIPYKIKLRISKSGGRIIHEEEFEQHSVGSTFPADINAIGPSSKQYPLSFVLNKDDILRKSGGERHLAIEVFLDWEGKYVESNEGDNLLSGWYDF